MNANLREDERAIVANIEVSLADSVDLSGARQAEGVFWIPGGERVDVTSRYNLEFVDGRSVEIAVTYAMGQETQVVHFRVLFWKDELQLSSSAPGLA